MKKIILCIVFTFLGLTTVAAQDIHLGVKGGANIANLTGYDVYATSGRISYHLGAVLNIGISDRFALQPELIYSAQGYNADSFGMDVKGALDYVNVPIMLDVKLISGLSLQAGPQIGINVSAKEKVAGETDDISDIETIDISVGGGAQYKLPMGLFFQSRFTTGLSKVVKDSDIKNMVVSVSVGWFFN